MDEAQQMAVQQQLDQMGAVLRDMAPQIAGYFKALVAAELSEDFAEALTMQLHGAWLRKAFPVPGLED